MDEFQVVLKGRLVMKFSFFGHLGAVRGRVIRETPTERRSFSHLDLR